MHELGEKRGFDRDLKGLSLEEFELFKQISKAVIEMTASRFGKRILPKGALLRAFASFRYIRSIAAPQETTILEAGPGSGYLGALLALVGYRYAATDIAQGFYLQQSNLWEQLFGDRLVELATSPQDLSELEILPSVARQSG